MNILVVDDDLAVANFCRTVLSEAGHSVLAVNSGADALAIVDNTDIDLIFTDLRMPRMTGIELLSALAERDGRATIVIMTGYGTVPSAVEAMRLGAYDYILKPVSPEELLALSRRVEEFRRLRDENRLFQFRLSAEQMGGMVGSTPNILAVFSSILRVAQKRHPVLITGETGTGKELVARAIHRFGKDPQAPFVSVDCGALAPALVESELFGHVRGAFTGAGAARPGLLATAGCGTLFLDEVGELPLDIQARLFRVIQEREFRPLGSDTARRFEARIIAATDKNLEDAVKSGNFRQELYFRINVYRINVPPLRGRRDDIPALVEHFLRKHGEGRAVIIESGVMATLANYPWPGNIRELENCVLRILAESEGPTVNRADLPRDIRAHTGSESMSPLEQAEKNAIESALETCEANVTETARRLRISKATLYRKLEKYGIAGDPPAGAGAAKSRG